MKKRGAVGCEEGEEEGVQDETGQGSHSQSWSAPLERPEQPKTGQERPNVLTGTRAGCLSGDVTSSRRLFPTPSLG